MPRMDAPSKVSMKGIGVSSKEVAGILTVVPEAQNDRTSSKTQVMEPVQDSDLTVGPCFKGASPVWGPMQGTCLANAEHAGHGHGQAMDKPWS